MLVLRHAWRSSASRYSIADIALVPFVKRIDEAIAPDALRGDNHPRAAKWWQTIQERRAFKRAQIGPFLER
jgi:glutathione S-transferase